MVTEDEGQWLANTLFLDYFLIMIILILGLSTHEINE